MKPVSISEVSSTDTRWRRDSGLTHRPAGAPYVIDNAFIALNAISNRMHEDLDAADRMITQLGDLLRAAQRCRRTFLWNNDLWINPH